MVQSPSDPSAECSVLPFLGSAVIIPTDIPARDNSEDEWWSDEPQLETELHRAQIDLLLRLIKWQWRGQRVYCSGNTTVYFDPDQSTNRNFRGPDVYVVFDADPRLRKSWMVWREGNQFPNVVFEILSNPTAKRDRTEKKQIYQDIWQLPNYFWFHPDTREFRGFQLVNGTYQELQPNERGHLWSDQMQLFVGIHRDGLLRLFQPNGELVPLPEEAAEQRAEQERLRAERLAERLRQLGIDPDKI
ncbi:MAG: Uma2 family endonuclease [Cyanothece sp. SIO2G6]|nr:Uma2 family endonuclease [Cyanothece sp. SIO2G6]